MTRTFITFFAATKKLKAIEGMGVVEACHLRIKYLKDGIAQGYSISIQQHFIAAVAEEQKFLLTISSNDRMGDPQ